MPSPETNTRQNRRDVTTPQVVAEPIAPPAYPEGTSVDAAPHTDDIPNADPHFEYQWVRRESLGDYLRPKRIGNPQSGFETVAPWEPVIDTLSAAERPRSLDSQGSPIDSYLQHGGMVAIRLPKGEYAKYARVGKTMSDIREKSLRSGESKTWGEGNATLRAAVTDRGLPSFVTHS